MRLTPKLRDCRHGLLASLAVAALSLATAPAAQAGASSPRESFSRSIRCPSIDHRGQLSHRDGKDAPCKFVVDHRTRKVVALVRGRVNNHSKRPQIHKNCGLVPPSTYGNCKWTRELYSVTPNGICSGIAYGLLKKGHTRHNNDRYDRDHKKGAGKGKSKGKAKRKEKDSGRDYGQDKRKGKDKGRDYGKDNGKRKDKGRDYGNDKRKRKDNGRDYGKGKDKGRDYGKGKDKGRDYGKGKGRDHDKDRDRGRKGRGGKGRGGHKGGGHGGGGNNDTEVT